MMAFLVFCLLLLFSFMVGLLFDGIGGLFVSAVVFWFFASAIGAIGSGGGE
mgnify:CR=1 FL=1